MRTGLDHLPLRKRRELERVLSILFEEFDAYIQRGNTDRRRQGRILKVVLFGSYARGGWVEDNISGYRSDYDILIVVNQDQLTDSEVWRFAEQRLIDAQLVTKWLKTPVNLIVHTISEVNDQLAKGRYFFADIVREGIELYDSGTHQFAKAQELSDGEARQEAQEHFDYWFSRAGQFYRQFQHALSDKALEIAAFDLHQTVESLYNCLLLVLTLYSPATHNIKFLRSRAEDLDARLIVAWPRDTKLARARFELLKRAYVEARYSKHYAISADELDWLAACVEQLRQLVEQVCREWLDRSLSP